MPRFHAFIGLALAGAVAAGCAQRPGDAAPEATFTMAEPGQPVAEMQAPPARPQRPILGFLRRKEDGAAPDAAQLGALAVDADKLPPVQPASLAAFAEDTGTSAIGEKTLSDSPATDRPAAPPRRSRLFGLLDKRLTNGAASEKPDLTAAELAKLPFGELARVCGLKEADLGKEVERSPGPGTFRLYDSATGSTAMRPHYLNGFKDGCPRQFNAAVALFGSPQVHEATRYAPGNKESYSPTDEAYERAKRKICKVGRGTPCPASRYGNLERALAFLTIYRGFGDAPERADLLLLDGTVAEETVILAGSN